MEIMGSVLVLFFGLVIFSVVIKYLWPYLAVRLFPGAVEQNLISKDIPWNVSIILAIIFLLIIMK